MAIELSAVKLTGLVAGADISANQFYLVKMSTTDDQIALCDTDGEVILGILGNKPDALNKPAEVMSIGQGKVECGEALAAGDLWGTDSAGKAKKIEKTVTGADTGDYVAGVVTKGAGSGEIAEVTIGMATFVVEAQ
jgi:hypothetical protein